jgi:hypothetical protein
MKIKVEDLIENYQAGIWWGNHMWGEAQKALEELTAYPPYLNPGLFEKEFDGGNYARILALGDLNAYLMEDIDAGVAGLEDLHFYVAEVVVTYDRGLQTASMLEKCGGEIDMEEFKEVMSNHIICG